MKKELKGKTASLKKTLAKMKRWAKEKDRRYKEQKKNRRKSLWSVSRKTPSQFVDL